MVHSRIRILDFYITSFCALQTYGNSFQGLENNLRELVLQNNQFRLFPLSAVKILKKLHSLDLSQNIVRNITTDSFTRLDSIIYLDMSDNLFAKINRDTLMSLPKLACNTQPRTKKCFQPCMCTFYCRDSPHVLGVFLSLQLLSN